MSMATTKETRAPAPYVGQLLSQLLWVNMDRRCLSGPPYSPTDSRKGTRREVVSAVEPLGMINVHRRPERQPT